MKLICGRTKFIPGFRVFTLHHNNFGVSVSLPRVTGAHAERLTVNPVGDDEWEDVDAVVYFWARLARMETGMVERLLAALRSWFKEEWRLDRVVYVTNERFTQQVDLIDRTNLTLRFELLEPGKPGKYLIFG